MTHHTPGPWHALTRENYTLGGDSIEVVLLNEEGLVCDSIAQVLLDTGDDAPEERKVWKQHEANARLIAAAPDLLGALKQVMEQLDSGVLVRDISKDAQPDYALRMVRLVSTINSWQLAIAKAEGRA